MPFRVPSHPLRRFTSHGCLLPGPRALNMPEDGRTIPSCR